MQALKLSPAKQKRVYFDFKHTNKTEYISLSAFTSRGFGTKIRLFSGKKTTEFKKGFKAIDKENVLC